MVASDFLPCSVSVTICPSPATSSRLISSFGHFFFLLSPSFALNSTQEEMIMALSDVVYPIRLTRRHKVAPPPTEPCEAITMPHCAIGPRNVFFGLYSRVQNATCCRTGTYSAYESCPSVGRQYLAPCVQLVA